MVNTEIWMGAHQALTLVPESELFLGYSPSVLNAAATGSVGTGSKAHLYKLATNALFGATSSGGGAFSAKYTTLI